MRGPHQWPLRGSPLCLWDRQRSSSKAEAACSPAPVYHSRAICIQSPQTENSMPGGILCSVLQFLLLSKKIYLLQTPATAAYVTVALVLRMFIPLVCLITLILDLYSGMIGNYSPPTSTEQAFHCVKIVVLVTEYSNVLLG